MDCPEPNQQTVTGGSTISWPIYAQNMTQPSKMTATVLSNLVNQDVLTVTPIVDEWWYRAAYPIQIRWKEDDFAPGVSRTTGSPVAAQATVLTGSHLPEVTSAPASGGGLATGAIVAIAVVLGVLAIAAAAAIIWWRRRRLARGANYYPPPEAGGGFGIATEKDHLEPDATRSNAQELDSTADPHNNEVQPIHELDDGQIAPAPS